MGHIKNLDIVLRNGGQEAVDAVNRMAADIEAMMPRWIPVGERLPEAGETVLLWNYVDHRLGWLKYVASGAAYFFSTQDECNIEPTHWMPLPEPPEVT